MFFEKGSGVILERVCYMCPKCNQGHFFYTSEEFSTLCPKCNIEMVCVEKKFVTLEQEEKRKKDHERIVNGTFHIPKCPTCGSPDVEKISLTSKVVGGALFRLFSSNVRKTMHCKNCGYKW